MDRRDFLRSSLAGIAAISIPFAASAITQATAGAGIENAVVPTIATNPHQHIIDALRLYDEVLASYARAKGRAAFTGLPQPELIKQMHVAVDDLFRHIYSTFHYDITEETVQVMHKMLTTREISETDLRKIPPTVIESAWPILAMKMLLRDRQMPINHRTLETFKEFRDKYGILILHDGDISPSRIQEHLSKTRAQYPKA